MGRLLSGLTNLFIYFCAATVVSGVLISGYVWISWQLDLKKLARIVDVARGAEAPPAEPEKSLDSVAPEQASYEEILERRALAARDLELREIELDNGTKALRKAQLELAEQQQKLARQTDEFESRLAELASGAKAQGRDAARTILESLKPIQAKEQIVKMLDQDELDEVVLLLGDMQESKRAKILGEFKALPESDKVAEVLRRIREGQPQAKLAESVKQPTASSSPL